MTDIGLIDNKRFSHLDEVLKTGLKDEKVDRVRIAVGYLYMSGLRRLQPELGQFLEDGGTLQIMIGNQKQQGLEELVEAHQNLNIGGVKFKQSQKIKWKDRAEVRSVTADSYTRQVLYESPSVKNQQFFTQLVDWLDRGVVETRLYLNERFHAKAYLFEKSDGDIFAPKDVGVVGSSNLSLSGLQSNTELNAPIYNASVGQLKDWFDALWEDAVEFDADLLKVLEESWVSNNPGTVSVDKEWRYPFPDDVLPKNTTTSLREVSSGTGLPAPYLVYVKVLYELYKETLETADDYLHSFDVYEDLYDFQKRAVNRGIRIANKHNGVLVSDVVGMGKTFVGLGLLEHFHARNRLRGNNGKMLIISPKHLKPMWERMVNKRYNFNAEVISMGHLSKEDFHETLLEEHDDTTVCLVDESHHYRNDGTNRYDNLQAFLPVVNQTILLTATPYTKEVWDVYNQIKLFHIEDVTQIPITPPNLKEFTKAAENGEKDLSNLLGHVMVRRTRQDIIKQYGEEDEGREYLQIGDEKRYLPERHLQTIDYNLHDTYASSNNATGSLYNLIINTLDDLTFARYSLGQDEYLKTSYQTDEPYQNLSSMGQSIRGLMKSNLLKRLESSVHSFYISLQRMEQSYRVFSNLLDEGTVAVGSDVSELINSGEEIDYILDEIDQMVESDEYAEYDTEAFHLDQLKQDLNHDIKHLTQLQSNLEPFHDEIHEDHSMDDKTEQLRQLVVNLRYGSHDLLERSDRGDKIIVFTQFTDTIEYLDTAFKQFQENNNLPDDIHFATATSNTSNVEEVIKRFAPVANDAVDEVDPNNEIDVLFATDVAGEGVNLQDANIVINFDLHWNPLRLIQRIGRVDRLGSEHDNIYAFNFLPETQLEEELGIVERVGERVQEISRILGEDGEILSPEDQINRSYMEDIYGEEDIDKVEENVNELIGSDDLIGPVSDLQGLKKESPDFLEWLENRDGIRSAINWDREYDGVVIVYRRGEYTTPYLVKFPQNSGKSLESEENETVVETIQCPVDEPVASVDSELFNKRYEQAVEVARAEFSSDMKERQKFQESATRQGSVDREYVLDELETLIHEINNPDQQQTVSRYQDIIETVSADQILSDFERLRDEGVTGDELVDAIVDVISRYNLEERYENQQDWTEEQTEPPHVVAGMYLKGADMEKSSLSEEHN